RLCSGETSNLFFITKLKCFVIACSCLLTCMDGPFFEQTGVFVKLPTMSSSVLPWNREHCLLLQHEYKTCFTPQMPCRISPSCCPHTGASRAARLGAARMRRGCASTLHTRRPPPGRERQGVFLRSFSPAINVWDFPMKAEKTEIHAGGGTGLDPPEFPPFCSWNAVSCQAARWREIGEL
uniref:Uncharacterized protein n=1 Tax=Poecilia mexicana TaxID=48701 RepID=A0A3B3WR97_9TELE